MIKAIFIDMDNTLIETQLLYAEAHLGLARFIADLAPHDVEAIIGQLKKTEVALFPAYGYSAELLPQAFEETLRHYVSDAAPDEIRYVRDLAHTVFRTEAALKDGVAEAIECLADHFPLYLVTAGDLKVQNDRIAALPFRHLFAGTFVVSEKDQEAYSRILEAVVLEPHEVIMIGDSIRSDIIPTVSLGMAAIYIKADNWHAHEIHGHGLPEEGVIHHAHLLDAAQDVIRTHIAKPQAPENMSPAPPHPPKPPVP